MKKYLRDIRLTKKGDVMFQLIEQNEKKLVKYLVVIVAITLTAILYLNGCAPANEKHSAFLISGSGGFFTKILSEKNQYQYILNINTKNIKIIQLLDDGKKTKTITAEKFRQIVNNENQEINSVLINFNNQMYPRISTMKLNGVEKSTKSTTSSVATAQDNENYIGLQVTLTEPSPSVDQPLQQITLYIDDVCSNCSGRGV
ncbi:MAG: hypothetical protein Tsb005_16720 [Gammaproteobacteria bacterium]